MKDWLRKKKKLKNVLDILCNQVIKICHKTSNVLPYSFEIHSSEI